MRAAGKSGSAQSPGESPANCSHSSRVVDISAFECSLAVTAVLDGLKVVSFLSRCAVACVQWIVVGLRAVLS